MEAKIKRPVMDTGYEWNKRGNSLVNRYILMGVKFALDPKHLRVHSVNRAKWIHLSKIVE